MAGTSPIGTEVLEYTYTSQAEMDSIFSELGVMLRLEDDYSDKGPLPYLEDIIDDATDMINQYCEWRYYPEDMAVNRWVRRRASWIAAYQMAQRRGNPKQFVSKYDEIMEELDAIYDGRLMIPRLSLRADFKPDFSNLVVEDRMTSSLPGSGTGIGWYYR